MRNSPKIYDQKYFDRWYRGRTIGARAEVERLVTLAVATAEYHLERPIHSVLDIGCGEGYYCRALAERLPGWQFGGLDLAKNAIFAANKAQPDGHFVIADPAKAPLLAGSAQVLLVNDLKIKTELLVSLLTPGGYLLHLQPGPRHQWQLRVSLNPVSMEHPLSWPALAGLVPVERQRCQFSMTMDQSLRAHVLETSRLGWRAGGEQRHAFTQQGPDELEQDLLLSLWQKPL